MDSQTPSSTSPIPHYASNHCADLTSVTPSRGVKRERSVPESGLQDEPEGVRHSKKLKGDASTILILSKENLRKLEEQITGPSSKRPASRLSTLKTEITQESQGSKSSIHPSVYRFQRLAAARVHIGTSPPDHVKAAIDAVIGREPTPERLEILKRVAKDFHARSNKLVSASDSEDDTVRVLLHALEAIKPETLQYQGKADWREELKPQQPQSLFSTAFLRDASPAAEEPRKRQQLSTNEPLSSDTSQPQPLNTAGITTTLPTEPLPDPNTMPPPAEPLHASRTTTTPPAEPPPEPKTISPPAYSYVKTPRPDVSIGINMAEITSRLASRLGATAANTLLPWLQNETGPSSKRAEPLLISVPAPRASNLAFAFAVGQGKAYSTGRPIFEAQNQAAVTGACALKIQLDLQRLTRQAQRRGGGGDGGTTARALPRLFFSVCTEGPTHELWAHYTQDQDGVPTFGSKLQKICHGCLLDTVESFLIAFDNVCAWGTGEFLDIVVENLKVVASAATEK